MSRWYGKPDHDMTQRQLEEAYARVELPLVGCKGFRSFPTMRDAWEAVQNSHAPVTPVPFRCSTCRWWHVSGPEVRDARHRVRVVEAA